MRKGGVWKPNLVWLASESAPCSCSATKWLPTSSIAVTAEAAALVMWPMHLSTSLIMLRDWFKIQLAAALNLLSGLQFKLLDTWRLLWIYCRNVQSSLSALLLRRCLVLMICCLGITRMWILAAGWASWNATSCSSCQTGNSSAP